MSKTNPLMDVAFGKLKNGTNVFRYSGYETIRRENIAEHSFHVIMISATLAYLHNQCLGSISVDICRVYEIATFHDILDEVFMGDIVAPAKYFDGGKFKEILFEQSMKIVKREFGDNRIIVDRFSKAWRTYELLKTEREVQIVEISDKLSMVSFMYTEYSMGNRYMKPHLERGLKKLESYVDKYDIPVFEKIYKDVVEFIDIGGPKVVNL